MDGAELRRQGCEAGQGGARWGKVGKSRLSLSLLGDAHGCVGGTERCFGSTFRKLVLGVS